MALELSCHHDGPDATKISSVDYGYHQNTMLQATRTSAKPLAGGYVNPYHEQLRAGINLYINLLLLFGLNISSFATITDMSFDQLSSLESQPTTMRRQDDPQYADDPEFQRLSQHLMTQLFTLTGNISRLSNEIALLGTKRDTERVRERVHDLLEESKDTFKEVGEGVKKVQSWEDVSVSLKPYGISEHKC